MFTSIAYCFILIIDFYRISAVRYWGKTAGVHGFRMLVGCVCGGPGGAGGGGVFHVEKSAVKW